MKQLRFLLAAALIVGLASLNPLQAASGFAGLWEDADKKEEKKPDVMSSGTFNGLRLRSIGPAVTSGRVAALAVHPGKPHIQYAGVASGGVWKTVNNGATWTPIFDSQSSYSIGAITIDPTNPSVIWVGSGENNSQRSVSYGDGVYRSQDGGRTWKNMGLKASEHIGKILVHPEDGNVVYVASQGPLWGPGGDRGLFKTVDGGKTWENILEISEHTGVTDIAMDPRDPDVIYAASYQRRRRVWTMINGGPESAIHKTVDGGSTWTKLRTGLPRVHLGRIGLAVSPADPDIVYAQVEAAERRGGIFRSKDRGATWERRNPFDATAFYYSKIVADPNYPDRLYTLNTFTWTSDDGGATIRRLSNRNKHVDDHALWINPDDSEHLLLGSDGGLYESHDRGTTWTFKSNLPVTQFYRVEVDNDLPFYNVYGGTQDNATLGGPSRTLSSRGIVNADWIVTRGGDGFQARIDPNDPNIVYSQAQHGELVRFDRLTGQALDIKPREDAQEPPLRWNWDSPLIISPHAPSRIYFAANILFRSDDRGASWRKVSSDLSRGIDRNQLEVMGKRWGPDAVAKDRSTSEYGNITALAESPLREGLLYVGTDDGLIQVSEDGGGSWRRSEAFEAPSQGKPAQIEWVTDLIASRHVEGRIYATFNNHKNNDFKPHIVVSEDRGRSWTPIVKGLPENGPAWCLAEDHVDPDLLFAGTEFGLFFSIDRGANWIRLKRGLPTIAVRDLAIQERENDLALGTFGRGFYILDDYSPLRDVTRELLEGSQGHVFGVRDALLYVPSRTQVGSQGDNFFTASNPPFGAVFTYYLKESLKTERSKRKEAEKKEDAEYPSVDQLRSELDAEEPAVVLTVTDSQGQVVRRLKGAVSKGVHRIAWNLRDPSIRLPSGGPGRGSGGPLVMPGEYQVSLAKRYQGQWTELAGPVSFRVKVLGESSLPEGDRRILAEFQRRLVRLQRALSAALDVANDSSQQLGRLGRAVIEAPGADPSWLDEHARLRQRLNGVLRSLRGEPQLRSRFSINTGPSVSSRVGSISGGQRFSTAPPTQTQRDQYRIAADQFGRALTQLKRLVETDIPALRDRLERAGAPWIPGRLPDWRDN